MLNYKKIIFVSTENTCLSPLAEAIMKKEIKDIDMQIESRGLVVLFSEPPNQKCASVANEKGINIDDHKSKPLQEEDFGGDVLMLVMSKQNKQKIYEEFKDAINVYTIKEFVGELGDLKTPYGGGIKEYTDNHEIMERLIKKVADKLAGEEEK